MSNARLWCFMELQVKLEPGLQRCPSLPVWLQAAFQVGASDGQRYKGPEKV